VTFSSKPDDATPLMPEEMREPIPAYISYRRELNEAEQENIAARAGLGALNRRRDPLSEKFVRELHLSSQFTHLGGRSDMAGCTVLSQQDSNGCESNRSALARTLCVMRALLISFCKVSL
jgi:hypothetical protein